MAVTLTLCGCARESEGSREVRATADELHALFATAGFELVEEEDRTSNLLGRMIDMRPAQTPAARRRFGEFGLSVLQLDRWAGIGLSFDDRLGRVHWSRGQSDDGSWGWTASKVYARGVQVHWRGTDKRVDARWRRLDRLLSRLER